MMATSYINKDTPYLISAIVSTYNSEAYLGNCLIDLIGQSLYKSGQLEIIIIDSGSEQNEASIAHEFIARHPHIVYQRTERETVYGAWNRGIAIAQGKYITNANTDDAHRHDALELLAEALEHHPEADLAYCNWRWTDIPNDTFSNPRFLKECHFPPYDPAVATLYCILGPHPLWRKTLFDRIGLFDASLKAVGDFDFQFRFIAAKCQAVLVPEVLSLFYVNKQGLSRKEDFSDKEVQQLYERFHAKIPIEALFAIDPTYISAVVQAWIAMGVLATRFLVPWEGYDQANFEYAAKCFRKALALGQGNDIAVHNLIAVLSRRCKWQECEQLVAEYGDCVAETTVVAIREQCPIGIIEVPLPPSAVKPLVFPIIPVALPARPEFQVAFGDGCYMHEGGQRWLAPDAFFYINLKQSFEVSFILTCHADTRCYHLFPFDVEVMYDQKMICRVNFNHDNISAHVRFEVINPLKNPMIRLKSETCFIPANIDKNSQDTRRLAVFISDLEIIPKTVGVPFLLNTVKLEPIRVLYDISVLGLSIASASSRTGIFRVVEHVAQGLAKSTDIKLEFCSTQSYMEYAPNTADACRQYLATHPEFNHIPFHGSNIPEADIFHSPFHGLPDAVTTPIRFLTVYDLIPVLLPQFVPQHSVQLQSRMLQMLKPQDRCICISEATKDDLCRFTGLSPERAYVSHLAADPGIFYPFTDIQQQIKIRQKYNIGTAPYILSLCTLEPRKNIDHVIRAFAHLVRAGRAGDTRLVLTGTKGWDFNRIFSEIDNNPELHKRVVLAGYVPDEELAALYSGATVFVYMSIYEGFGLPPLEAMQCGTPVITSNTSSLPEVVGDAGIMLDPHDLDGLCTALETVIINKELRDDLAQRALKQAARFSWDRCVKETIAAYRKALAFDPAVCDAQDKHGEPKKTVRLYFYRPEIDFLIDSKVCYILTPLILGTSLENEYEMKTDPAQWRFHPISHDWRNNPMWDGYQYDPDLFTIAETPEDADFFVFPYLLDEMIECAGVAPVASWLCQLPYYKGSENKHLFMTLHDSSEPFGMDALFFRASVRRSVKDSRAYALPYPVENFQNRLHFDPDRIKYDVSFVGFIGDSISGPIRGMVVNSLEQTSLLRTFVSASERFHGFEEPHIRTERRELFLTSLADSWLVICPRGAGENSYRFFETLSMGRIPVLISDDCSLPFEDNVDYGRIILRIPEESAGNSAELIARWLSSQTVESLVDRCRLARNMWEQYFACPQWNRRIIETVSLPRIQNSFVIDGVIFQLQQGRPFGISRLWLSLLTELAATPMGKRIVLLDREETAPEIPGIRLRKMPAFHLGTAQEESLELDRVCREEEAGLFISTYYTFTTTTPSLLMLYDMIPERFDSVVPDALNPEWRDKYHAIVNSSAFAAISQSTARDLATFYPQAAQRPLTVIPCAVSDAFRVHSEEEIAAFKAACGITKPYFLLVGRRDPHKNVELFFDAFGQLPDRENYALVMAGSTQSLEPKLRKLAGMAEGYAGFFSDEALSLVYSGAVALVYPSLYEGFGLPILEAMKSGCPVITCQNSSIPEVAGSAALYVGEHDVAGMSKALVDVQQHEVRSYLVKRGLERARHFSWKTCAELFSDIIQSGKTA